jgi:hypothetical protein
MNARVHVEELNTWEQKKRFHAMVRDFAEQIPIYCDLEMSEEDWKRLFIGGSLGQKIVPNPIGVGFVVMNNHRIRNMPKINMTDLITQMLAFGNERGVQWTDPEWQAYIKECEGRN